MKKFDGQVVISLIEIQAQKDDRDAGLLVKEKGVPAILKDGLWGFDFDNYNYFEHLNQKDQTLHIGWIKRP